MGPLPPRQVLDHGAALIKKALTTGESEESPPLLRFRSTAMWDKSRVVAYGVIAAVLRGLRRVRASYGDKWSWQGRACPCLLLQLDGLLRAGRAGRAGIDRGYCSSRTEVYCG